MMTMNSVFWHMTPCRLVGVCRRFRVAYCQQITLCRKALLKRRNPSTNLHSVTSPADSRPNLRLKNAQQSPKQLVYFAYEILLNKI
jgi:hypothetical protein